MLATGYRHANDFPVVMPATLYRHASDQNTPQTLAMSASQAP
jgi:hypothetical protein